MNRELVEKIVLAVVAAVLSALGTHGAEAPKRAEATACCAAIPNLVETLGAACAEGGER